MHLRAKIVVILCSVVALYAVSDHVIQRLTVTRGFSDLERQEAVNGLRRVTAAIEEQVAQLDELCVIRSAWDATYEFVADGDRSYVDSNLGETSLRKERLDLLFVCDLEGRVVWGDVRAPGSFEPIGLKRFPSQRLAPSHPLLAGERGLRPRGVMITERGPLLACARPILTSEGRGPARGTLILGRFLAGAVMEEIRHQTGVSFDRWALEGGELPPAERAVLDDVTASVEPVVREHGRETLHVYTEVADVRSQPSLLLRANVPRDITRAGAVSVRYALISTVAAGLLMLLVLLGLIQRAVLGPILKLTRHAVAIGKSDDLSASLDMQRPDEIGVLANEFDTMTAKLAASRAAVIQSARSAGMSEIAVGILHNVGNVLNSVNVSAALIGRNARDLGVNELEDIAETLAEHAQGLERFVGQDPRGKHLQPYLSAISRNMRDAQCKLTGEVANLTNGIEHIRELINSQQEYASRSRLVAPTALDDRMEEALAISTRALATDDGLEVVREYDRVPAVLVDKHKLLEILVNLVQNARQAMAAAGADPPRLTLRIRTKGRDRVCLEVADNGVGIPPEDQVRIFNHGFTTRSDGHGFGLHSAANAAAEMGGTLRATSDGPGRGASFVLELPLEVETATAATR